MDPFLSTLLILAGMAAIVLVFRAVVRRPRGVTSEDSPGLRTVAVFSGTHESLFADDYEDKPLVGVRLFDDLCRGLAAAGVQIAERGPVENAQRAECVVGGERYWIVLEWLDPHWSASLEWVPRTPAERRHLTYTGYVYSPPDTPQLRELLIRLDRWLKSHSPLSDVAWHRKERWLARDATDPRPGPIET
jgi:hypothetical protein